MQVTDRLAPMPNGPLCLPPSAAALKLAQEEGPERLAQNRPQTKVRTYLPPKPLTKPAPILAAQTHNSCERM